MGVACGLTLAVSSVLAGPNWITSGTQVCSVALGQSDQSDSAESRQAAEKWLRQAREAMKNGNLELAEYCLERCEKLDVKYDPLFARFKDTPDKVRKDLESLRASRQTPAANSDGALARLFNREAGREQPPTDPYQGQAAAAPPTALPGTPTAGGDSIDSGAGGDRQQRASELLLGARQALARGDVQRATLLTGQAKALGLSYPANADSPARVEAIVQQAAMFAKGPAPGTDPAAYTRDFSQFLLDQATGLLGYQSLDAAQQLAQQAHDLRATYGQFDRTPEQVLTQIAAVRRQIAGSPGLAASGDAFGPTAGPGGAAPRRLPAAADTEADPKAQALRLVAQARAALDRGDLLAAKQMAEQAQELVPDTAYGPDEPRPWMVLLEVNQALNRRMGGVAPAAHFDTQQAVAKEGVGGGAFPVSQGVYDPTNDPSRNVIAQTVQPTPAQPLGPPLGGGMQGAPGERLFLDGLRALENHDRATAMRYFREAWQYEKELDPELRRQLQDKLMLLQANDTRPNVADPAQATPLEAVDAQQQLLRQKLHREIVSEQAEAQALSVVDPKEALDRMKRLRLRVNDSEVDPGSKKQLLTMVDRSIESLEQYILANKSDIELAERNRAVLESVELDGQRKLEVQNKLASLVEEFNRLLDERRYAEAERIAKQARELDPEAEVVQNLMWQSRFVRRMQEQLAIDEAKERGFYDTATSVLAASEPFDDRNPIRFGDAKQWRDLTEGRGASMERQRRRLSAAELEIQKSLNNQVDVKFSDRPLSEVMDMLSELAGVPIVLDPTGMAAEGVTSDTPITIRLTQQISLRSALNLILSPLRLSYVIQDEVLRVTSEQTRSSNVFFKVYNVADLVIPIPNFIPGYNTGLAGAIQYAHSTLGYGNNMVPTGRVPITVAGNQGSGVNSNTSVLAQMGATGMLSSLGSQSPPPQAFGPGGMGGAAIADFDTLIELIRTTIAPDSWDEFGGAGAIEPFPINLSLVISQTQEVHEQIADLLDQLRVLQDLQVTIEVRFITLNDNFFERIGIDFDFSIDDNVNVDRIRGSTRTGGRGDDTGPSAVFGLTTDGPTSTLDLEFTQGSFGATLPQFGAFDPATAANFGFAILSDLEVFFLLQAAEGDQRTNVLQAPKVTLFNGQTASVQDQSQRPFVTSIIPVVGDFAAAQMPVIVVLNEGTQLNVQAVVSSDRRFVRLTLVPFFSRIGPVQEFTFEGRTTSDSGTTVTDPTDPKKKDKDNAIITREGTTVQLPTFIFTTVSTTVSVPDGGTVLLGGIKRLSEGRNERGVPMLSKIPYVNRLFKNVGIGRETQSLMMMVTPRIIIQQEEELRQTGFDSSQ